MQRPAEMIWSSQKASGDPPSKRSGHSMCIVGDSAYIFGGNDFRRPPGPNADLFKLDMSSNEFYWSKMDINGRCPEPRSHHTAVAYGTKVRCGSMLSTYTIEKSQKKVSTQKLESSANV